MASLPDTDRAFSTSPHPSPTFTPDIYEPYACTQLHWHFDLLQARVDRIDSRENDYMAMRECTNTAYKSYTLGLERKLENMSTRCDYLTDRLLTLEHRC